MADPLQFSLVQELESQTGRRIQPAVAAGAEIVAALDQVYRNDAVDEHAVDGVSRDDGAETNAPPQLAAVSRLDEVVRAAVAEGASDLYLEPAPDRVIVRQRIDGVLRTVGEMPVSSHREIVAELKRSAGMDEGETRLPQEGRLRSSGAGVERSLHVSTIRTLHGERIRIRAATVSRRPPALDALGMSPSAIERLRDALRHPSGLVLAVGPAGSGRTTTISAAIAGMSTQSRDIIAVGEQPPEYDLPGVAQMPIATTRAEAFAAAARQGPEVVLVDRLDDAQTAARAIDASSSGLLVLSTVTADDAHAAVQRLVDFRIEAQTIASALVAVVTERLVRRLCRHCRERYALPSDVRRRLRLSEADAIGAECYRARGCSACAYAGYRGRIGLFEVMPISGGVRPDVSAIRFDRARGALAAAGMTTLHEDALAKVMNGTTTADELLRVLDPIGTARPICSACGFPVSGDYVACPRCGNQLGGSCPQCGRSLLPAWRFCPYCS
jgi:type IV pilus assembly protein PilB